MNLIEKKTWEPGQNLSRQTPSRSGKFKTFPASTDSSRWLQKEPKWLIHAKCLKPRHQPGAICECYQLCMLQEMAVRWPQMEGYWKSFCNLIYCTEKLWEMQCPQQPEPAEDLIEPDQPHLLVGNRDREITWGRFFRRVGLKETALIRKWEYQAKVG